MTTPAELREQFLALRASGAPLPAPRARTSRPPETGLTCARPPAPAIEIDRSGDHDAQRCEIARAVASLLGWQYQAPNRDPDSGRRPYHPTLSREDGAAFFFHAPWPRGGFRVEVMGEFPESRVISYRYSARQYGEHCPYSSISCAGTRTAESIAADIERRFLPGYLEEWAFQVVQRDEGDARKLEAQALAAELAKLLGGANRGQYGGHGSRHEVKRWFSDGSYQGPTRIGGEVAEGRDGTPVNFDISTTPDIARRIVAAIVEGNRAHAAQKGQTDDTV